MKVCIECTTAELLDFAELLVWGRNYRNTVQRDVRARDDVPNRYREEGVQ